MERERQLQKRYGELQEEIRQKQEMLAAAQTAQLSQQAVEPSTTHYDGLQNSNQYDGMQNSIQQQTNEEM